MPPGVGPLGTVRPKSRHRHGKPFSFIMLFNSTKCFATRRGQLVWSGTGAGTPITDLKRDMAGILLNALHMHCKLSLPTATPKTPQRTKSAGFVLAAAQSKSEKPMSC
jgi:hypothetical protein